jgi:NAD+ synthase
MAFSKDVLAIDAEAEIRSIASSIRTQVPGVLRRKGAVVAVSGGIDSATCAALCAKALGPEHVLALFLPERDSSPASLALGRLLAARLGIPSVTEDIAPVLEGAGCYRSQLEAVQMVFPEADASWKFKIVIPSLLKGERLNLSRLTVEPPAAGADASGTESRSERMSIQSYLQLVAATNFKQRTRTMMAYYHADRLNYAVCGTPNRLEYDQGFFVKGGDGLADFKPIAHLYKTQVFEVARALGVPVEILERTPTTDTFSLAQTQEEFYFALPYGLMDLCLYGHNHGVPAGEVAACIGLTADQVERVYRDIDGKRRGTLPLHVTSLLASPVPEIEQMLTAATASPIE